MGAHVVENLVFCFVFLREVVINDSLALLPPVYLPGEWNFVLS